MRITPFWTRIAQKWSKKFLHFEKSFCLLHKAHWCIDALWLRYSYTKQHYLYWKRPTFDQKRFLLLKKVSKCSSTRKHFCKLTHPLCKAHLCICKGICMRNHSIPIEKEQKWSKKFLKLLKNYLVPRKVLSKKISWNKKFLVMIRSHARK